MRVTTDLRALEARASRALAGTAEQVAKRATALMNARTWAWPGTTHRQNGTVVGRKRNIVDTGTLRDSLQPPRRVAQLSVQLTWNAEYAAAVFLGAVFRKRQYSLPARNAPLQAVRSLNMPQVLARAWRDA
ncbi:hypothetical protein GO986_16195 [Deinococcus sp. HMF7620]|uniref:HK97 gp10 family phage protein n=1 Tax=Deinococcus arboris TaxID=2682977 RepID=A0A7C9HTB9_9DEIO|nr:hypothetical protein [Deinococcus arboris]MVN88287.1 hypothetical protein [Deinococcus arboris]